MGGLCGQSRSGGAMGGMGGGMGRGRMGGGFGSPNGMGQNSAGGFGYPPSMAGGARASVGGMPGGLSGMFDSTPTQSGLPRWQRDQLGAAFGFTGNYTPDASGGSDFSRWLTSNPTRQSEWQSLTTALNNNPGSDFNEISSLFPRAATTQSGMAIQQRNNLARQMGYTGAFNIDGSGTDEWDAWRQADPTRQNQWAQTVQQYQQQQQANRNNPFAGTDVDPNNPFVSRGGQRSQYAPMGNGGGYGGDMLSGILGRLMQPQQAQPQPMPIAQAPGSFGSGSSMGGLLGQLLGIGGGGGNPYNTQTGSNQNPMGAWSNSIRQPYDFGRSRVNSAGQYPAGQEWRAMI